MQTKCYPWQKDDYNYLLQLKNRLPHAILLHGPAGVGILELAYTYIYSLFCEQPTVDGSPCHHCNSCILLSEDAHPDFFLLSANEDGEKKPISIDDVRRMLDFLALSTHISTYKIILIENVNELNQNSANALLKILEEPPVYAIFILLSNNLHALLPTIVSRCHKYRLSRPDFESASDFLQSTGTSNALFWLKYYDNCPLFEPIIDEEQLNRLVVGLSKPSIESLFDLSREFDGKIVPFGFILEFLDKFIGDLLSYKLSGQYKYFTQYKNTLENLIVRLQPEKAFYLHDKLNFLISWSNHPLNYKLQLENIFFQYQQLFVK